MADLPGRVGSETVAKQVQTTSHQSGDPKLRQNTQFIQEEGYYRMTSPEVVGLNPELPRPPRTRCSYASARSSTQVAQDLGTSPRSSPISCYQYLPGGFLQGSVSRKES